jgi:hypothetical protein
MKTQEEKDLRLAGLLWLAILVFAMLFESIVELLIK